MQDYFLTFICVWCSLALPHYRFRPATSDQFPSKQSRYDKAKDTRLQAYVDTNWSARCSKSGMEVVPIFNSQVV